MGSDELGGGAAEGSRFVRSHTELIVYRKAFAAAMAIYRYSRSFPGEERFSLTDQIRRSSRSVCANLAEAWRKRPYPAAFVNKLTDAEGEAAETQTWLQFAVKCGYLSEADGRALFEAEDEVLRMLTTMRRHPARWKT